MASKSGIKRQEPTKVTIVMIHGSGCDKTFLKPLGEELSEYNVVLVDLPGHGNNKQLQVFEEYVNYVKSIAEEYEKVILLGHSLGGTVMLEVLSMGLDNIIGGIGICTGASFPTISKEFLKGVRKGLVDIEYLLGTAGNLDNPEVINGMARISNSDILIRDFIIAEGINVLEDLNKIQVPVLLLVGEDDVLAPRKSAKCIQEKVPISVLIVYPEFKHMLPIANKQALGRDIKEFVLSVTDIDSDVFLLSN